MIHSRSGTGNNMSAMAIALIAPLLIQAASAADAPSASQAEAKAEATLRQMTPQEKTILTIGIMPLPIGPNAPKPPAEAIPGAGYIAGLPRLNVPSLRETDASLGVSYVFGLRKDGATALPSGLSMASTWNSTLIEEGGRMIGSEARAKGFNVLLAGGANLMRDPRNGRNFEYLGEDPLLAGTLAGHAIRGVQSNHIIATIKHFALNGQETGRKFVDSLITPAAAHESDLLAFKLGIEIGNPGSVMCAYNKVNGENACANSWLLNDVLKKEWGYKGFVMSDWGAVPNLDAALKGLDQQSGSELDKAAYFGDALAKAGRSSRAYARRIDDMNKRILWAIYDNDLDTNPATPGGTIDFAANAEVARKVAEQGIVLLRNTKGILPLAASAKNIAVIGGYADTGVLSGAGSSQVQGEGGPSVSVPLGGTSPWAVFFSQSFHKSNPLAAIRALAPKADIRFRDGRYIAEAVAQAKAADVAIVFATQWSTEGLDQPDLSLPNGQDALIAAVADANPNTIVVLETGGPVLMPWLEKTAAVIEAWYPGAKGGEAIAAALFGKINPSGRLPITFPASVDTLPRKAIDGFADLEPDFAGDPPTPDAKLTTNYNIEGSDLGYRWNAREGHKALFPFGYGLSYTSFDSKNLVTDGKTATFSVSNTGKVAGATVAQLYLVSRAGNPKLRLVGFQRVELEAGASTSISLSIDPRLLADWRNGKWVLPDAEYVFAIGDNAERLGAKVSVRLEGQRWVAR